MATITNRKRRTHAIFSLCLLALTHFVIGCESVTCDQKDQCSCTFDDGTVLDITSLGNKDKTPRFKDVLSGDGNYYSYNPCYPFNEASCSDAAMCILSSDKSESVQIGDASRTSFTYSREIGHVVAAYTSGDIKNLRLSEAILVCDKSACKPSIIANGRQDTGEFKMTVTTVCACPDGCDSSGPKNCGGLSGLSVGSILCIVFVSVLILYVVIGTVTMKFVKKKEGIEVIPNVTFWRVIPVLVKTGVLFTVGKFRRRQQYDAI